MNYQKGPPQLFATATIGHTARYLQYCQLNNAKRALHRTCVKHEI